ncbi:hypothetical protein [Salarchaeum sp. JOR-1]|uniref:hypothetical protein n=1 Tax=Salarchaeum sp. JOR-1 TaxID=2599399 RepID=UPI001198667D|nr:hypothetical protein [Salarchaeum sp. JOR-1]QDX40852.1 hypothetical protein FQU85_08035 [Salarchaeum sp. JOR-1]
MTELSLDYPLDDAKDVVKTALERTDGISEIDEGSRQIVGKTGISFPRVLWSYGENIYIDFSDSTDDGQTPIDVWAEKSVWLNIGANPQKYKRAFLTELEDVRGRSFEERDSDSFDLDETSTTSHPILATLGYPVSIVVGGYLGMAAITSTMLVFGTWIGSSGGILGILAGVITGGAVWYHRHNPEIRSLATYLVVAVVGLFVTAFINSASELGSFVTILLFFVLVGTPISVYLYRRPTTT